MSNSSLSGRKIITKANCFFPMFLRSIMVITLFCFLFPLVSFAAVSSGEVVFIDPGVRDYQKIVQDVPSGAMVVVLAPGRDGVVQINEFLSLHKRIEAVHIVSHGSAGRIILGNSELGVDTVDSYAPMLRGWNESFTENADILVYGCNVASTFEGVAFVNRLGEITGAGVAASDDVTGASDMGGDWKLEYQSDADTFKRVLISAEKYEYTLATYDVLADGTDFVALVNAHDDGTDDTIRFTGDCTVTLGSELDISGTGKLTIDGNGFNVIIDGGTTSQIFYISSTSADLTIDGLTLTNGYDSNKGGAIYNKGNLNIFNCNIDNNKSDYQGGAIFNDGGTIKFYGNTISGNTADSYGDGILNDGTINIYSGDISGNSDNDIRNKDNSTFNRSPDANIPSVSNGALLLLNWIPTANDQTVTSDEDNQITITLTGIDNDLDTLSYKITTLPSNGGIYQTPDGSTLGTQITAINEPVTNGSHMVIFVPNSDEFGNDYGNFGFKVNDGNIDSLEVIITVNVNAINDEPSFTKGADQEVDEDAGAQTVTGWATNISKGPANESSQVLTFQVSNDNNSLFSVQPSIDTSSGNLTYTPASNAYGSATVTVALEDNGGTANGGDDTSPDQTFSITVNAVNDPPTANSQSISTDEDTAYNGAVSGSDTEGDSLSYSKTGGPSNGSASVSSGGSFTYTPTANYYGSDSFTFSVSDGNGGNATGTVSITVNTVNDAPTANNQSIDTNEDTAYSGTVSGSDTEGDSLSYSKAGDPSNGSASVSSGGSFTYTPTANYYGSDSFTFSVSDGNGGNATGTVSITVNTVNDTPTANNQSISTNEDTAYSGTVSGSDTEGDSLSYSKAGDPSNGSASVNSDGSFTYTPSANYYGFDSFTFNVSDGDKSTTGTVSITVNTVNDAPTANNQSISTNEDTAYNGTVSGSDTEGDSLSYSKTGDPSHGSASVNSDGSFTYTPSANYYGSDSFTFSVSDGDESVTGTVSITVNTVNDAPTANDQSINTNEETTYSGTVSGSDTEGDSLSYSKAGDPSHGSANVNPNGTFIYTPSDDYTGFDSFTFNVSDGNGGSATGTVSITVNDTIHAPVANDDSLSTNEDTPLSFSGSDLTNNDTDDDGDSKSIISFTQPSKGTLTFDGTSTYTYTPNTDYNGSDKFTYKISDGNGGTDEGEVTISISKVNDKPVFIYSPATSVFEDSTYSYSIRVSDPDGDSVTIIPFRSPDWLILSDQGNGFATLFSIPGKPDNSDVGTHDIWLRATDTSDAYTDQFFTITVVNTNDTPYVINDPPVINGVIIQTIEEGQQLPLDLLTYVADPDKSDKLFIHSITTGPDHGVLSYKGEGRYNYIPNSGYYSEPDKPDTFTYIVSDGNGGTVTVRAQITVKFRDDPPIANADTIFLYENREFSIDDILANDKDPEDQIIRIVNIETPANGTLTKISTIGIYRYDPDNENIKQDEFTYEISDGKNTAQATVRLIFKDDSEGPYATDDKLNVNENNVLVMHDQTPDKKGLLDNDPEGWKLFITKFTQPVHGQVYAKGDGSYVYTPNKDYNGPDRFTYTVSDGTGVSDTAEVEITVNTPPVVGKEATIMINKDEQWTVTPRELLNMNKVTDTYGGTLAVTISGTKLFHGRLQGNDDGSYTYTPDDGYTGTDSFEYIATDGIGGFATAKVNIIINASPEIADDSVLTEKGTQLEISFEYLLSNDTDADTDKNNLSVTQEIVKPGHGTLSYNTYKQAFIYTPASSFTGKDTFIYTVSDGMSTGAATVNIFVNTAKDDNVTATEDIPLEIPAHELLSNDTHEYPPADKENVFITGQIIPPKNGHIKHETGKFIYTPGAEFNGTDSFAYYITDNNGGTDSATVFITVDPVNDSSTASGFNKTGTEDKNISFAATDFTSHFNDIDGNTLEKIRIDTLPVNGILMHNNETVTTGYEIETTDFGTLAYTPAPDWHGTDSFNWKSYDGTDYSELTATVSITVKGINDPPTVDDISRSGIEDTKIFFAETDFTNKFNDVDNQDMVKIKITSLPKNGRLMLNYMTVPLNCQITANEIDSLMFIPDDEWYGSSSFGWNGSDGTLYAETSAKAIITLVAENDPGKIGIVRKNSPEDQYVAFLPDDFTSQFHDADGDPLASIKIKSLPDTGTLKFGGSKVSANQIIDTAEISSLVFIPKTEWNGVASFRWDGSDGTIFANSDAIVYITIRPVNDRPTLADINKTGPEDSTIIFSVSDFTGKFTDKEKDSLEKIMIMSVPAKGTLKLGIHPISGSLEIYADSIKNLSYIPAPDWDGSASFMWNGSDGTDYGAASANVNIVINSVNDRPTVEDFTVIGAENTETEFASTDFTEHFNDPDDEDTLKTVRISSLPSPGILRLMGEDILEGHEIDIADISKLAYIPAPNWNGTDSFDWTGNDGYSYASPNAAAYIDVPPNCSPGGVDDSFIANQNTELFITSQDLLKNDKDYDGDSLAITGIAAKPFYGTVIDNGNGKYTYKPEMGYYGPDSFSCIISDSKGGQDIAVVNISVAYTLRTGDTYDAAINENTPLAIIPGFTSTGFTPPSHGEFVHNDNGTYTYTPDPGYTGQDSFIYTDTKDQTGKLIIDIVPQNIPPYAEEETHLVMGENTDLHIFENILLENHTDPEGDSMKITDLEKPAHGRLRFSEDGVYTYLPEQGYSGTDTISYDVSDGMGRTSTGTVNIEIIPEPRINAKDDNFETGKNTDLVIWTDKLLENDESLDGTGLRIIGYTKPSRGRLVDNENGSYTYIPETGFIGTDRFACTVSDENGFVSTGMVSIEVGNSMLAFY